MARCACARRLGGTRGLRDHLQRAFAAKRATNLADRDAVLAQLADAVATPAAARVRGLVFGAFLRSQGRPAEALRAFAAAVRLAQRAQCERDLAAGLKGLGLALADLGRHAEARECLREAERAGRGTDTGGAR